MEGPDSGAAISGGMTWIAWLAWRLSSHGIIPDRFQHPITPPQSSG